MEENKYKPTDSKQEVRRNTIQKSLAAKVFQCDSSMTKTSSTQLIGFPSWIIASNEN